MKRSELYTRLKKLEDNLHIISKDSAYVKKQISTLIEELERLPE